MATPSSTSAPFVALAAALALALSAARNHVAIETALLDTVLLAALAGMVWATARARYGERGAGAAALALVLFAPTLGAVGGGGLPAALLLVAGLTLLSRCLLDPTVQRIGAAGLCLGLAAGVLHVEGAARPALLAWLAAGGAALAVWRTVTAERCESRPRVLHGAGMSLLLTALVGAAALAGLDALPPFEPTEYARVWPAAAVDAAPAATASRLLLLLNAIPLLVLAAAQRPHRPSRYADGATVIGLGVVLGIGVGVPVLLAPLAAPWLALLAGAAVARARRGGLLRLAAAALILQALTAALLWPDYPRASEGWVPLPARAQGVPT